MDHPSLPVVYVSWYEAAAIVRGRECDCQRGLSGSERLPEPKREKVPVGKPGARR